MTNTLPRQAFLEIPQPDKLENPRRCKQVKGHYQCVLPADHGFGQNAPGCRFVEPMDCEGGKRIYYVRFALLSAHYIVIHDLKAEAPTAFHAIVGTMKYLSERNRWDFVYIDASTEESLLETPVMRNVFEDITTESLL